MNKAKVGKFIAKLRNEKKLTQEQLAEKLNVTSYKTISKWECGTIPDFETMEKLSNEFDVSLYELSIGEKVDKDKLHLKDIPQYISNKEIKKLKTKTKLKYLLFLVLGILAILSIIFTINNYNTTQIYNIESDDENYIVSGTLIKTKKESILTIDNIGYIGNDKKLMNQTIKNYEVYLQIDNKKNIYFDDNKMYDNTLEKIIDNHNFITKNKIINSIKKNNTISFCIKYKQLKDKYNIIDINLKLKKTYANNTII